jgi:KTSC domain
VQREPIASSSIAAVGYDAGTRTLEIEFHNGRIYQFFGVPHEMAQALRAAESTGAYFNKYVRDGGYEYFLVRDA